jgi:hypothetical protein
VYLRESNVWYTKAVLLLGEGAVHRRREVETAYGSSHNLGVRQQRRDEVGSCYGADASSRIARPHNKISGSQALWQQLLYHGLDDETAAEVQSVRAAAGQRNSSNKQVAGAVLDENVVRVEQPGVPHGVGGLVLAQFGGCKPRLAAAESGVCAAHAVVLADALTAAFEAEYPAAAAG